MRNQVSAAEVVGTQCAEQNILRLATDLTREVDEHHVEINSCKCWIFKLGDSCSLKVT